MAFSQSIVVDFSNGGGYHNHLSHRNDHCRRCSSARSCFLRRLLLSIILRHFRHRLSFQHVNSSSFVWAKERELLEYIFSKSVKQEHYILARVLLKTKVVEVWDSLSDATQPILYSARIKDILRNLDLGLEREIRKKPENFSFSSFRIVRASFVPRQPNGFDCGMFVILFMQSGCKVDSRSFVFDSNEERCRLACWLANSNYNKHRDILMNDVREFYLKMNM
ncbi:hypothetical protein LguiB_029575 [Lonicera macranthoides]